MISKRCRKILTFYIRMGSVLRVIPYDWDERRQRIRVIKSFFSYAFWWLVMFSIAIYWTFLSTTLLFNFALGTGTLLEYGGHAAYWISFVIVLFELTIVFVKKNAIAMFLNQLLSYYQHIENVHAKGKADKLTLGCETVLSLSVVCTFVQTASCQAANIAFPLWGCYITSYLPDHQRENPFIFFLTLIPHTWVILMAWTITLFLASLSLIYVKSVVFISTEMRANRVSQYTKNSLRNPSSIIRGTRCLQILTNSANAITRDWILTIITNMLMIYTVTFTVGMIKVHHLVPMAALMAGILDGMAGGVAIVLLYLELGDYHESSKKLLGSWKRDTKTRGQERRQLSKHLRSCRILRMEMGSMGYFQKKASTRVIGKIIYYVNKVLMLTKNIKF